ncbi:hypothetical protein Syun_010534 [Stephania yunnanensis]|uniref:Uncharacterized protein n=1 Tax=Stephania yunnanensis TaxID=152371 RepID=A0AAP0KHL8_9MAGN
MASGEEAKAGVKRNDCASSVGCVSRIECGTFRKLLSVARAEDETAEVMGEAPGKILNSKALGIGRFRLHIRTRFKFFVHTLKS